MKVVKDIFYLSDFEAWGETAKTNRQKLIDAGYDEEFFDVLMDIYPEGLTETEINDILWFEDEFLNEYFFKED